jgi:apolipoprotein N-acyltransferase
VVKPPGQICPDPDYPRFIRGYGATGVKLMLVPAWDWEGPNAAMQERMALGRGVENGFAIARSAKTGLVSAHDAFGRTPGSNSTFAHDPVMLVGDVPLGPGTSLFAGRRLVRMALSRCVARNNGADSHAGSTHNR